jgi:hypothetical protein
MGYNVEISVNMLKETKFSEVEKTIQGIAEFYSCDNIYSLTEEDGTKKIPIYHCVYVINFVDENFDNLVKFLKFIKHYKSSYIECIYENDVYKLLYASSFYLKSIDKELSKKYKQFIKDKNFTPNETKLLRELI